MSYDTLRQKLDSTVQIEFVETPVKDVIAYLSDFLQAPLRFDVRAMEEVAIHLDAPVTLSLKDVKASTAMRIIFDQINESATPIEFVRREGVIEITTRTRVDRELEPRVYLVRDLPSVDADSPEAALATVMNLIRTSVEPASWEEAGGHGTIAALPKLLVIRQTPRIHNRIDELLHSIREAAAEAERDPPE